MSPSCRSRFEALSAHADGALSAEARAEIEQHVRECADCGSMLAEIRAAKRSVAVAKPSVEVPEHLELRVSEAQRAFVRGSVVRRFAPAAAGGVALAAALVLLLVGRTGHHELNLAEVIVEDHIRYYPAHDPTEIASADPVVVSRWLSERLPFEVAVPALAGARLVGGRRCTLAGERVALLFYERDGTRLSLFVFSDPSGEAATRIHQTYEATLERNGACAERMRGYGLCVRRSEGHSYVLVSELDSHAMGQLLASAWDSPTH